MPAAASRGTHAHTQRCQHARQSGCRCCWRRCKLTSRIALAEHDGTESRDFSWLVTALDQLRTARQVCARLRLRGPAAARASGCCARASMVLVPSGCRWGCARSPQLSRRRRLLDCGDGWSLPHHFPTFTLSHPPARPPARCCPTATCLPTFSSAARCTPTTLTRRPTRSTKTCLRTRRRCWPARCAALAGGGVASCALRWRRDLCALEDAQEMLAGVLSVRCIGGVLCSRVACCETRLRSRARCGGRTSMARLGGVRVHASVSGVHARVLRRCPTLPDPASLLWMRERALLCSCTRSQPRLGALFAACAAASCCWRAQRSAPPGARAAINPARLPPSRSSLCRLCLSHARAHLRRWSGCLGWPKRPRS